MLLRGQLLSSSTLVVCVHPCGFDPYPDPAELCSFYLRNGTQDGSFFTVTALEAECVWSTTIAKRRGSKSEANG